MFARFESRIGKHGLHVGEARSYLRIEFETLHKIGIGTTGCSRGSILLLSHLFRIHRKAQYALLESDYWNSRAIYRPAILSDKLIALGAPSFFRALGMLHFCRKSREYFLEGEEKKIILDYWQGMQDHALLHPFLL